MIGWTTIDQRQTVEHVVNNVTSQYIASIHQRSWTAAASASTDCLDIGWTAWTQVDSLDMGRPGLTSRVSTLHVTRIRHGLILRVSGADTMNKLKQFPRSIQPSIPQG